jgi:hypothetical protein
MRNKPPGFDALFIETETGLGQFDHQTMRVIEETRGQRRLTIEHNDNAGAQIVASHAECERRERPVILLGCQSGTNVKETNEEKHGKREPLPHA